MTCTVCRSKAMSRGAQYLMCDRCCIAYDRFKRSGDDGTIAAVIAWTAKRVRRFAERKEKP